MFRIKFNVDSMSDAPEYQVVTANDPAKLSEKVTHLMTEGWQPHGNPFIHESPHYWAQAMIKQQESKRRPIRPVVAPRRT